MVVVKTKEDFMALNIILWILFGALAGWIASIIMRTNQEQGAVGNVVIGILGALLGSWVVHAISGNDITGFNFGSLVIAVIGSVILLAILRTLGFMGGGRDLGHRV